jgi:hypothetical protein
VDRGIHIRVEAASSVDMTDPKVRAVLFGQRARRARNSRTVSVRADSQSGP